MSLRHLTKITLKYMLEHFFKRIFKCYFRLVSVFLDAICPKQNARINKCYCGIISAFSEKCRSFTKNGNEKSNYAFVPVSYSRRESKKITF